jgi:hypothetical protein
MQCLLGEAKNVLIPFRTSSKITDTKNSFSLESRISVYRCFWSKFEIIEKYERIIKVEE